MSALHNTTRWRKLRKRVLAASPLCVICLADGRTEEATQCDHITPLHKGGAAFDRNNIQTLCAKCHEVKSAYEARMRERGGDWIVVDENGKLISGR